MSCVLGIDVGSSAVKAGLFDPDGALIARSSVRHPTYEPQPGWKEQDPEQWWSGACHAIRECLSTNPGSQVGAIGVTGHISSLTFVNAHGKPLRRSIGFQDVRAVDELDELYRLFSRADLAAELGVDLPPAATWPLPRLLWFRKHEPDTLRQAHCVLQAKDYVNYRLTGRFFSDVSSSRGMVSFLSRRPAYRVLESLGLNAELIPPLARPHEVIGETTAAAAAQTGLKPGIPVVAGWNDLNACVLGSGVLRPGEYFNITGTSEHLGAVTELRSAPEGLICAPFLDELWLLYGATLSGGGSLQWYLECFGGDYESLLAAAETVPAGSGGLIFLPYLEGERAPIWDARACGAFVGIRSSHREPHFVRAVLEGVAFGLRQIQDIIAQRQPPTGAPVVISGGAARSALWNRIKSGVLGRAVTAPEVYDAGIMGAALLASCAAGWCTDPLEGARAMVRWKESWRPDPELRPQYDALYEIFCELYPALRASFHKIRSIVNSETVILCQKKQQ